MKRAKQVLGKEFSRKKGMDMKTIRVVAAVICDNFETKRQIFATARGYGEFEGWWEFPGGKIEPGETPKEALVLWAVVRSGDLVLKEAEAARWLTKDRLEEVQWLPADLELIERIREEMGEAVVQEESADC